MKFSCDQKDLARALNTVSRAVPAKTPREIMKCIKLETEDGDKLTVTATNMDMKIMQEIPVTVSEPGSAVVMARLFSEIIRKLNPGEILIEEEDDGLLAVKTETSELKVVMFDPEDFPEVVFIGERAMKVEVSGQSFAEMIAKTAFAASLEEARGVLTGVLIEMSPESMNMVALDGFRLAVVRERIECSENKKVIIDARLMSSIGKIIQEEETENITLYIEDKHVLIEMGSTVITVSILEGEFLDYRKLLDLECSTSVIVERRKLIESIERASLLAKEEKNNLIRVNISDSVLNIFSSSEEGAVYEEVIVEKDGEDLVIGFNAKYMTDVLKAITDDAIRLEMSTELKPCLIKQVSSDRFEYLVLPVRVPR